MDSAGPELPDGRIMLRGWIALMLGKAITGVKLVKFAHETIASDLGEDAGGGDRIAFAITLDEGGLGVGQPADPEAIDKDVLGPGLQLVQSDVHGAPGGLADIDLVD